tara:strand:+ start:2043 stop:2264 length:222 start_codon:yes stop_codon:yes gene_type:complete
MKDLQQQRRLAELIRKNLPDHNLGGRVLSDANLLKRHRGTLLFCRCALSVALADFRQALCPKWLKRWLEMFRD